MMQTIDVGKILDDRYEILGLLGQGGMGSVYRARQIKLDRIVALKIPNAAMLNDIAFMRRFEREARTCARFTHDNIVTIHDVMVSPDLAYICMEYVEGDPLDRFVATHFDELAVADVVDLIGQICDGLHRAHEEGIIHRDIKPANLLVTRDKRRVKIMDFGIARVAEATVLTLEGSMMGTPYYMAPEQIRGEALSAATDIYALTIVIYRIFTNRMVFDGEITQLIYKHVSESPTPPRQINPQLPEGLNACLLKGLEKNPQRRYAATPELFDDLREATAPVGHLRLSEIVPMAAGTTRMVAEPLGGQKPPGPRAVVRGQSGVAVSTSAETAPPGGRRPVTPPAIEPSRPPSPAPAAAPAASDRGQDATIHRAATHLIRPREPTPPGGARPQAAPNLGLLVLKAILRAIWGGLKLLVRGFARLPQWAKAAVLLAIAALAVGHAVGLLKTTLLRHGTPTVMTSAESTPPPTPPVVAKGAPTPPTQAVGETTSRASAAQPVEARPAAQSQPGRSNPRPVAGIAETHGADRGRVYPTGRRGPGRQTLSHRMGQPDCVGNRHCGQLSRFAGRRETVANFSAPTVLQLGESARRETPCRGSGRKPRRPAERARRVGIHDPLKPQSPPIRLDKSDSPQRLFHRPVRSGGVRRV